MKQVFLHVGNFKTGTTALQRFCSQHRGALERQGVDYPEAGRERAGRILSAHHPLIRSLRELAGARTDNAVPADRDFYSIKRDVRQTLEKSSCERLLISSEAFYLVPQLEPGQQALARDELRDLFSGCAMKVIIYVREPFSFACSWYNQVNKQISKGPVDNFVDFACNLDESLLVPGTNVAYWRECFGPDSVILLPYRKDAAGHIAGFLRVLGVDESHFDGLQPGTFNTSNDALAVELNRLRKIRTLSDPERQAQLLRVATLADADSMAKAGDKLASIAERFNHFCELEGVDAPHSSLSLQQVLAYSEKVNGRDAWLHLGPRLPGEAALRRLYRRLKVSTAPGVQRIIGAVRRYWRNR